MWTLRPKSALSGKQPKEMDGPVISNAVWLGEYGIPVTVCIRWENRAGKGALCIMRRTLKPWIKHSTRVFFMVALLCSLVCPPLAGGAHCSVTCGCRRWGQEKACCWLMESSWLHVAVAMPAAIPTREGGSMQVETWHAAHSSDFGLRIPRNLIPGTLLTFLTHSHGPISLCGNCHGLVLKPLSNTVLYIGR